MHSCLCGSPGNERGSRGLGSPSVIQGDGDGSCKGCLRTCLRIPGESASNIITHVPLYFAHSQLLQSNPRSAKGFVTPCTTRTHPNMNRGASVGTFTTDHMTTPATRVTHATRANESRSSHLFTCFHPLFIRTYASILATESVRFYSNSACLSPPLFSQTHDTPVYLFLCLYFVATHPFL